MNCPSCSQPIGEHVTDYGDMACAACGLAGPHDVLDVLAFNLEQLKQLRAEVERLKSPAVVLAEAERLLREASVCDVWLDNDGTNVSHWVVSDDGGEEYDSATHPTLAEAFAELKEGNHG
jgi:hypothetical protein